MKKLLTMSAILLSVLILQMPQADAQKIYVGMNDYGDAENTYRTLAISGGAYHQLTPRDSEGNRATLGRGVTFELDGKPSPMADADEDDGIVVDPYTGYVDTAIVVGAAVQLPVTITGGEGGIRTRGT